ncbi:MAG: hypothetical protein ABXS91_08510 [Sulfurimonas sp.]
MSHLKLMARKQNLAGINVGLSSSNEEVTLDAVITQAVQSGDKLVQLDEIMPSGEHAHGLADTLLAGIQVAQNEGVNVSADAIDLSIATAGMVMDSMVSMDGIDSVDGSGIVATAVAFNQYVILNSNIAGLDGNIGDMEALKQGDKDNLKFKCYTFNPIATDGMGDIADGTVITPANASKTMALAKRSFTATKESTVLTYTFDVKAKTGGDNYAIGRGTTEVIIGDTGISLNDYEVSAQESKPKRTITTEAGKQIDMVVDYAAGTIVVTLEDDATLADGTIIYATSSLSHDTIGEIRGFVGSDIADYTYVAFPATIGTKATMMDIRQVNQALKHALLPVGLQVAGQKIASELLGLKIDLATQFSKLFGTPVDLTTNRGLATTNEAYKLLTVSIDKAAVAINEESMLTDKVCVIGGMGLVDAFGMMAKNTDGLTIRDTNEANAFKFLGYLDGKYPAYYDPRHDAKHPLVDENGDVSATAADNVYSTLQIIGTPSDPSKRAVISGVGLPIVPVDLKINDNSEQKIALEGKLIADANKDPKARKLAKKILFRTH